MCTGVNTANPIAITATTSASVAVFIRFAAAVNVPTVAVTFGVIIPLLSVLLLAFDSVKCMCDTHTGIVCFLVASSSVPRLWVLLTKLTIGKNQQICDPGCDFFFIECDLKEKENRLRGKKE